MTLKQCVIIAHNLKGFDGVLLLSSLTRSFGTKPSTLVLAGAKIMTMKFKTVTFIDSLNHVPGALESFPKTFGLPDKFKKGFFPHKFNLTENQDYVGEIPDKKYFEPHLMPVSKLHDYAPGARACRGGCKFCEFQTWYEQQLGKTYDFKKELREYCQSDVDILTEAMEVYQQTNLKTHGIDPLLSVTTASYATKTWITNTAPSLEEIDKLEGYDEPTGSDALEGNFEQFDPAAAPTLVLGPAGNSPSAAVAAGAADEEKYGPQQHQRPFRTPLAVLTMEEYKKCKQGFHGGRTEVFQIYKKLTTEDVAAGYKIMYLDLVSLYPKCQVSDFLPYGVPVTKEYDDDNQHEFDLSNMFGMVCCDVTCPQTLLHPLLGGKKEVSKGEIRFVFDLRPFKKAWFTTVELVKAVSLGYRITKVYETISFRKSNNIYKKYMRSCIKTKIEANGFDGTPEEQAAFVAECNDALGIKLGPLVKNPGLKACSKLSANSLWGRTGMRVDKKTHAYAKSFKEFQGYVRLAKEKKIVIHERINLGDCFLLSFTEQREKKTSLNKTNVALCAFVTANARLRLYEMIERQGDRMIYCDTDSCIYLQKPDDEPVVTGKQLGDWEDEFDSPDEFIVEVVALAPKTYAYRTNKGGMCVKSKGFSLNHVTYEKVNFASYVEMAKQQLEELSGEQLLFKKSREGIKVSTTTKSMQMRRDGFKRRIVGYDTRPFTCLDYCMDELREKFQ